MMSTSGSFGGDAAGSHAAGRGLHRETRDLLRRCACGRRPRSASSNSGPTSWSLVIPSSPILCIYLSIYVSMCIHPSMYLSVYLSTLFLLSILAIYLSTHLSIYPSIYLCIYLSLHLSISPVVQHCGLWDVGFRCRGQGFGFRSLGCSSPKGARAP